MSCPTMLIAGWADGYRNNTFRVIEEYERNGLPWRLFAGPWVHKDPSVARPGPNVDADREIVDPVAVEVADGDGSAESIFWLGGTGDGVTVNLGILPEKLVRAVLRAAGLGRYEASRPNEQRDDGDARIHDRAEDSRVSSLT